jgi:putative tryptophan/tyrosine transport system substrate-binding protein
VRSTASASSRQLAGLSSPWEKPRRLSQAEQNGVTGMSNRLVAICVLLIGTLPLPSAAETPPVHVGLLMFTDPRQSTSSWSAFLDVLRERGWVEGHNLQFFIRTIEGQPERAREVAAELIALHPEVIIAMGSAGTQAVREKTTTIPIVTLASDDPVRLGFISSLAHPGGNITGISNQAADTFEKAFEILTEARPSISRVALFWAPAYPASRLCKVILEDAAPRRGITLQPVALNAPAELDEAFTNVMQSHPDALILHPTPVALQYIREIAEFAVQQHLLTFSWSAGAARQGVLLGYAANWTKIMTRAAALTDKILRGTRPADIPAEQPTKFDFVINLKTARAIGIEIPPVLLVRADEVIE